MSRLPPALRPLWPLAKRIHRFGALCVGYVSRLAAPALGSRAVPRRGRNTSAETAALEPAEVTLHPADGPERHVSAMPAGDPPDYWTFAEQTDVSIPAGQVLEIRGGVVVGDYGAVITPQGTLDYETSPYFGIAGWREHPVFLRGAMPKTENFSGTLLVLAARGGSSNYYHFLMDVLPRLATYAASTAGIAVDAYYVPNQQSYAGQLLELAGIDDAQIIQTRKHRAVRADRLVVPNLPNDLEYAPERHVRWIRETFPPVDTSSKPRRIFVTRGNRPNTRRLVSEPELWPELQARGFERIDPGTLSVRDQIDHFAAAELIVGVHGAAMTNVVFASPGVRVLELFAPAYVHPAYWAILRSIPGSEYRYLLGDGRPSTPGVPVKGIDHDIHLAPDRVLEVVDRWLG